MSEHPVVDIPADIVPPPKPAFTWSAATKHWLPALILFLATVVLWEAAVRIFSISSFVVPAPTKIVQALIAQWGALMHATAVTAGEILFGFLVSVAVGVALALVIVRFDWLGRALYPLVVLFQNVPKVAHEEHEGEEHSAEDGVRGDFAEDVAGDDAHASVRNAHLEFSGWEGFVLLR